MNRKQLILLLVVVVLLGLAGWHRYQQTRNSWESGGKTIGGKLLAGLQVNDVASILIKAHTNELNLVKKDIWQVKERNNYPANFNQISEFLLKAQDLKVVQNEELGPSQYGRYKLLPPGPGTNTATLLELRDQNGKTLKSLLLGKEHKHKSAEPGPSPMGDTGDEGGWPDGRYVMVGSDKNVSIISDAMSNVEPTPGSWLNKDFFKVEKVQAISVTYPVATNSWKVSRVSETADWKLADAKPGEQLDSTKTSGLSTALSSPTFNDVYVGSQPESLGLEKPTVIVLNTFDDFTYTLTTGQKTNDVVALTLTVGANFPKERTPGKDEKPDDKTKLEKEFKDKLQKLDDKLAQEKHYENWKYLVSGWTLDSILKERGQLLVEKKEEPKKEAGSASASTNKVDTVAAPAETNKEDTSAKTRADKADSQ